MGQKDGSSPKTWADRIGLKESDLKEPKHDLILKKCLDKNFLLDIIKKEDEFSSTGFAKENVWKVIRKETDCNFYCLYHDKILKELPSLKDRAWCGVGNYFYDKCIFLSAQDTATLYEEWLRDTPVGDCIKYNIEKPILDGHFTVGFCDFVFSWQQKNPVIFRYLRAGKNLNFFVEIKTKFDSVGAIAREINFYKNYLPKYIPVLIVPEVSDEDRMILINEGIRVETVRGD